MQTNRRRFLKSAGVTLALPLLDSLATGAEAKKAETPRRMVFVCAPLGMHTPNFFPEDAGQDYKLSPYLEVIKDYRNEFTVASGLSHPDVGSSHDSIFSFLTAAPHPENRAGFRNSISVDQFAAEKIGHLTRFPSLALSSEGFGLSWTRTGALVPPDLFPGSVFAKLFIEGRPDEVEGQLRKLRDSKSILDTVGDQAKSLQPGLGHADKEKLDEYFTSVRELEKQLARTEEWNKKPKPKVSVPPIQNVQNSADLIAKTRALFDLMHLAIQTDSTRIFSMLMLGTSSVPPIQGVSMGHHDLSHHGQDQAKLAQLRIVEVEKMKCLRDFFKKLKDTKEGDETLLDRTTIFFSSNLGSAATHNTKNLPVLVAGGGFKHGQHLAFGAKSTTPLSNVYVSMLQRTGIECSKFGSSNGTLSGL